jgi:uncharacterized LabA/DUF88 family protein
VQVSLTRWGFFYKKYFDMERVIFYVDGFNFYHGLKKNIRADSDWQKFYWIDFVELFQQFVGANQSLEKLYYFTAPPPDADRFYRQRLLFHANSLINGTKFEVIDGKFFQKIVICKKCNKTYKTYEEKHTDVNIAIKMIDDCLLGNVDTIALVSADGDLLTPLKLINERFPNIKIRIYFPPSNKSDALKNYMKSLKKQVVQLGRNKARFIYSIMPEVVTKDGISYTIPAKWKI